MATVKSIEYTKETADPIQIQDVGLWGGNVQVKMAEYEAAALPANDVIQMVSMKAGERVVETILFHDDLGSPVTLDVGDGADVDRFIDGDNGNVVGIARAGNTGAAIAQLGHQYTADDTIDVTVLGAAATGTIKLIVLYTPAGG